jgi:hypothetical protein
LNLVRDEDIFNQGGDKARFSGAFITADADSNWETLAMLSKHRASSYVPVAMLTLFQPCDRRLLLWGQLAIAAFELRAVDSGTVT